MQKETLRSFKIYFIKFKGPLNTFNGPLMLNHLGPNYQRQRHMGSKNPISPHKAGRTQIEL